MRWGYAVEEQPDESQRVLSVDSVESCCYLSLTIFAGTGLFRSFQKTNHNRLNPCVCVIRKMKRCYRKWCWYDLGFFSNLRKATINVVMSVRPSARLRQLGSQWTDFNEVWYLSIFRKSVEKTQVSLKSDNNNVYFTLRRVYIYISLNYSKDEKLFRQNL